MEILDQDQVRVLGVLIEKKLTTPEYYPLTLNALTTGCNQKSNRDPVVNFAEQTVVRALDRLRDAHLVWEASVAGSRVPRYRHEFENVFKLDEAETAVLGVLMLRGPQTVGEIRGRTGRMHNFSDLDEVQDVLTALSEREEPLVLQLPRQSGRKECRYAHLLAGTPEVEEVAAAPPPEAARLSVREEEERWQRLEAEVAALRSELTALQETFVTFKQQFE